MRDGADRTPRKAELLEGEGVVADMNGQTGGDKADRARRDEQLGFQNIAVRYDRQGWNFRVRDLAYPGLLLASSCDTC
jgi:hypothetical protein